MFTSKAIKSVPTVILVWAIVMASIFALLRWMEPKNTSFEVRTLPAQFDKLPQKAGQPNDWELANEQALRSALEVTKFVTKRVNDNYPIKAGISIEESRIIGLAGEIQKRQFAPERLGTLILVDDPMTESMGTRYPEINEDDYVFELYAIFWDHNNAPHLSCRYVHVGPDGIYRTDDDVRGKLFLERISVNVN